MPAGWWKPAPPPEMDRPGPVLESLHVRALRKKLDSLYKLAWVRGLKTTYYLRSLGARHVEKSTMTDTGRRANRPSSVGRHTT